MHANGNDAVHKDLDRAVECYKLAAEKGFVPAMQNLAACYASLGEHGWAASLARLPRAALVSRASPGSMVPGTAWILMTWKRPAIGGVMRRRRRIHMGEVDITANRPEGD